MIDNLPSNYDSWRLASPYDDDSRYCCDRCEDVLPLDSLQEVGGKLYCEYCVEKLAEEEE